MKNNSIIIVECVSSSVNYIKDIIDEGYEPVLLELGCPKQDAEIYRQSHDSYIKWLFTDEYPHLNKPRIINSGTNYSDTLEIVRKQNPTLILPGCDNAIEIAMKLSRDLGLKTNSFENFPVMRNKYLTQEALKSAGVRYIKSSLVHSYTQANKFFNVLENNKVVMKPVTGTASVGVHICRNNEAYEKSIKLYSEDDLASNGILMQEYIDGTEYICNTVSCNGIHKVTGLMESVKVPLSGYANVYDRMQTLNPSSEVAKKLTSYIFKVLDAIGIKYGPVHSEIMVDKNGPVLIEANCRLCGSNMKAKWLDRVFGNHESNIALQSYLHPSDFLKNKCKVIMEEKEFGVIKCLSIDHDMFIKRNIVDLACKDLPGVDYIIKIPCNNTILKKTIDLATCPSMVFLADKNPEVVKNSLKIIDDMQQNHPEYLYEIDNETEKGLE